MRLLEAERKLLAILSAQRQQALTKAAAPFDTEIISTRRDACARYGLSDAECDAATFDLNAAEIRPDVPADGITAAA